MAPASEKLIVWSRRQRRALPWRGARDPYRIWISEIMLQQTRVSTVVQFYRRFLKKFPTVAALARADINHIRKIWEGLGYYSRAGNLRQAAVKIQNAYGGRFPPTAEEWEDLPGIGRYTAAAIAALAFDEPAPALDANARRILARLYAYPRPIGDARSQSALAAFYQKARGRAAPRAFFQSLMDLGQLLCLPRSPLCGRCPLSRQCMAYRRGIQNRLPVRSAPKLIPHYDVTAAVIRRGGRVLLARRPEGKLLGGMWEFPGGKVEGGESLMRCLKRELKEELGVSTQVGEKMFILKHSFSHFRISLHVFPCRLLSGSPRPIGVAEVRWVRIAELGDFPMGRADRKVVYRLSGGGDPD
jgi:A/G-specific adenine glycosylase